MKTVSHSDHQAWELAWWGTCANTFAEEAKQLTYAHLMGLVNVPRDGKWPVYDLEGRSVLDLGGGPTSMLLKTVNGHDMLVVDPCPYPQWVEARYEAAGIRTCQTGAEDYRGTGQRSFDECWIYNCLQHVVDPERVIATARAHAPLLRIFEWIETPSSPGHPHTLHADELNDWTGATGTVAHVDENGAVGLAYYGALHL